MAAAGFLSARGSRPLRKKLSLTATGDVVPAVTGRIIVVLGYSISASAANVVTWQSHDGVETATDLSGAMPMASNANLRDGDPEFGLFQTISGEALRLQVTADGVKGYLTYVLAKPVS